LRRENERLSRAVLPDCIYASGIFEFSDQSGRVEWRIWVRGVVVWWMVSTYLSASRIESFWARARHREVFPVPGGPWRRTTLFQDTMLTVGQKSGAYSQASLSITSAKGRVRTVNVRIAQRNGRVDVIQQFGLDTVWINQALPETFQTPAGHLAYGGGDDFLLTIATSGAFFVGIVRAGLEHVDMQVCLGDWNGSIRARRF